MKVVHLSTYDTGGAAVAAERLHIGLLGQGLDSNFLSLKSSPLVGFPGKYQFVSDPLPLHKRLAKKFGLAVTQSERNKSLVRNHRDKKYEVFSFPLTDHLVEDHPMVKNADVINLHWVSNFINYPSFFVKVRKPIVWTLHDMNPLLGGFHYMDDKLRNINGLGDLERRLASIKIDALQRANSLTVVTPSKWLGENLILNDVLKKAPYMHIPYGLDLTVFKPNEKTFSKSVFNLPLNKKIILFVSGSLANYRKGFDLLTEAINGIDFGEDFVLVAIGSTSNDVFHKNDKVIFLGKVNDDRIMSLLFSAADAFVLPSREDNFPNVMLESMACGTPVLTFAVGGMKDIVEHGFNGLLAEDLSASSLKKMLEDFINGRFAFSRDAIRKFASDRFDLSIQAKHYIRLYEEILSSHRS